MKISRNDPCPCGSGAKYKRCCLERDESAASQRRAATNAASQARAETLERQLRLEEYLLEFDADELTADSNAVIDLIEAGRLDEAEQAARALLERYPEVHDGYDRLGMVYEARGDRGQAAHWYRQCLTFVRAHPELYDDLAIEARYARLIEQLDPQPAA